MKQLNLLALIIMMVSSLASFAQDGVSIGNWRTHLPYQKVIDVEPVGNKIYAATPFELFYYDTPTPMSTSSATMAPSIT